MLSCLLWSTAPDVYAVVRCENDTIRTRVFKADANPEFNLRTIFYRRYPNAHISIEVWHIYITHTHRWCVHTLTVLVYILFCAVVEQRSAVGLGARQGSTPNIRVREESELRDRSTRWPILFRLPTEHLRWDVLQRLPHRLVTARSGHLSNYQTMATARWKVMDKWRCCSCIHKFCTYLCI